MFQVTSGLACETTAVNCSDEILYSEQHQTAMYLFLCCR